LHRENWQRERERERCGIEGGEEKWEMKEADKVMIVFGGGQYKGRLWSFAVWW
jgi:hypothetical protein